MADDWFRTSDWSTSAQEDFELRLRRARPYKRPQYLRIKALSLMDESGKEEARGSRELLSRVIELYPDSGDVVLAHECLGELDAREGDRRSAVAHYRAALRLAPERHTYGDAALRLPELLIEDGSDPAREEARQVLDAIPPDRLVFASQRFRFAVARARLARAARDNVAARQCAENALREAERSAPDFPRHPTVGFVHADRKVLKEMRKLAGG